MLKTISQIFFNTLLLPTLLEGPSFETIILRLGLFQTLQLVCLSPFRENFVIESVFFIPMHNITVYIIFYGRAPRQSRPAI